GLLAVGGATGGDEGPLGVAGRAGVVGDEVVGAGGAHHDGVEVAVVLAADPGPEQVGVPRGDDRDRAVPPGVLHAFGQLGAEGRRPDEEEIAEAQVHHLGAVVDDPVDAGVGVLDGDAAAGVGDLGHHEFGVGGDAGHADAVVLVGGDDAGDVRAVAHVVLARPSAVLGVALRLEATGVGHDLPGQVLVFEVHAGVDDADLHVAAGGAGPRRGGPDLHQVPLFGEARIVGGAGGAEGEATDEADGGDVHQKRLSHHRRRIPAGGSAKTDRAPAVYHHPPSREQPPPSPGWTRGIVVFAS